MKSVRFETILSSQKYDIQEHVIKISEMNHKVCIVLEETVLVTVNIPKICFFNLYWKKFLRHAGVALIVD